ncbi:MAG: hypothetical protein SGJ19_19865 [Planctomycetia bacterium]|nr:hypothetical protein [Planctomycetia bacterium]
MVATMEKADKQYQCEDLNQIDWSAIKGITKKPIPAIAQKMVKDVIKQTPKKYKAPYAKLGLVKGDMVLRIKDGSAHVADLILVEAADIQQGGGNNPPVLSNQDQRAVDQYRQAKEALPGETKRRLQTMERDLGRLDDSVANIKDRCAAVPKQILENQAAEMQRIRDERQVAQQLMQDLQNMIDDTTTQVMDPHRSGNFAKAPDAAQGDLRKELLVIAGKCWTGANANFSKMEGVIKRAESLIRVADTTIQAAQNNVQGATSRGQAALQTITDTTVELENEYQRIVAVFGNKNTAGHLISFIANKTKNVVESQKMDDKHAYLDQVVNQLKLVSGKTKQVYAGLEQVRQQATSTANGVEKANRGHQLIKPILVRLVKVAKDCETAKKTWGADLTKSMKAFEDLKTLVGTDKKAAGKVSEKAKQS